MTFPKKCTVLLATTQHTSNTIIKKEFFMNHLKTWFLLNTFLVYDNRVFTENSKHCYCKRTKNQLFFSTKARKNSHRIGAIIPTYYISFLLHVKMSCYPIRFRCMTKALHVLKSNFLRCARAHGFFR